MTYLIAFWHGFRECRGDAGLTWDDNPYHPLSVAYDRGRSLGIWLYNA